MTHKVFVSFIHANRSAHSPSWMHVQHDVQFLNTMKPKIESHEFKSKTKQKEQEKKATDFYIKDCKILRIFATSPLVDIP